MEQQNVKKQKCHTKENEVNLSCSTAGSTVITNGCCKHRRWSLGEDVCCNPPLLADMGVCVIGPDEGVTGEVASPSSVEPTPTPPTMVTCSIMPTKLVLQPLSQNMVTSFGHDEYLSEDYFVYKRRRLEPIGGDDRFNRMSDELVLAVFRLLPKATLARCAQVCRRWKRLSFDETLWRRVDLAGKTLRQGIVGRVMLRGATVLRLAKSEVSSPIFSPQLQHIQHFPPIQSKLQCLDLSMAAIEPNALEEMMSICRSLTKISLEHCTLNDAICGHLSHNIKLDTLNLALGYGLNKDSLVLVMNGCSRLKNLNLAWVGLPAEAINAICQSLPSCLERLNLSGCRSNLTDETVATLVSRCPNLIELDVSDATHITSVAVNCIISELSRLQYVAFSRCYSVQPDTYLELREMPQLQCLDLYGILSDATMVTLRAHLPLIKVNSFLFSSVARPTVGIRRTSVWGLRVRD